MRDSLSLSISLSLSNRKSSQRRESLRLTSSPIPHRLGLWGSLLLLLLLSLSNFNCSMWFVFFTDPFLTVYNSNPKRCFLAKLFNFLVCVLCLCIKVFNIFVYDVLGRFFDLDSCWIIGSYRFLASIWSRIFCRNSFMLLGFS